MLNDTLFSELVDASRDLPGNRWAVGGNAPVMAGRMATEGCDVLLGGSFSPDFTDVLSKHIAGTPLFPSVFFCILVILFHLSHFLCPLPFLFALHVFSTLLCLTHTVCFSSGR